MPRAEDKTARASLKLEAKPGRRGGTDSGRAS